MRKKIVKRTLVSAHRKDSGYPPLYQLHYRVETVAAQLAERQKGGWVPLKRHVDELFDISTKLKALDMTRGRC